MNTTFFFGNDDGRGDLNTFLWDDGAPTAPRRASVSSSATQGTSTIGNLVEAADY